MKTRLMLIHALSPVHSGTGQSLGAIDLAIARDRATGMPYIPGSSIKGTLRALSNDQNRKDTVAVFGPETDNASDHAGAVAIGDANLLLLPVRSVAGTFSWVTSPFLLARFARDAREAGLTPPGLSDLLLLEECRVCPNHSINTIKQQNGHRHVVFEDLDLKVTATSADAWADFLGPLIFGDDDFWQEALQKRMCIVHDDIMTFLSNHAVDVCARIRMVQEKGTVDKGGLWYEENLPAESILSSMLMARPNSRTQKTPAEIFEALDALTSESIQLGGNATVGRGRCRATLISGGKR